jgi:hypothetical protein
MNTLTKISRKVSLKNERATENAARLAYLAKHGNPTGRYVSPDRYVKRARVEAAGAFVPVVHSRGVSCDE